LKWKNEVTGLLTHLETLHIENASDIYVSFNSLSFTKLGHLILVISYLEYILLYTLLSHKRIRNLHFV
jgi:hypothetical protein